MSMKKTLLLLTLLSQYARAEIVIIDPRHAHKEIVYLNSYMERYQSAVEEQKKSAVAVSVLESYLKLTSEIQATENDIASAVRGRNVTDNERKLAQLLNARALLFKQSPVFKEVCTENKPGSCPEVYVKRAISNHKYSVDQYEDIRRFYMSAMMQVDPKFAKLAELKNAQKEYGAALDAVDAINEKIHESPKSFFAELEKGGLVASLSNYYSKDSQNLNKGFGARAALDVYSFVLLIGLLTPFLAPLVGGIAVLLFGAAVAGFMIAALTAAIGLIGGHYTADSNKALEEQRAVLIAKQKTAELNLRSKLGITTERFESLKAQIEKENGVKITLP